MNQFFKETSGDKKIRVATSVTVVILALCAGILSYDALRNLAVQAGIPPLLAILFPITIDGLILSGSLLMLFFANKGKRSAYGFFLTALGVISSVAGNVAVSVDNLVSQLVHATSPVVLFLSIEALTILLRWRSKMAHEAAKEAQAEELARELTAEESRANKAVESPTNLAEVTHESRITATDNTPQWGSVQDVILSEAPPVPEAVLEPAYASPSAPEASPERPVSMYSTRSLLPEQEKQMGAPSPLVAPVEASPLSTDKTKEQADRFFGLQSPSVSPPKEEKSLKTTNPSFVSSPVVEKKVATSPKVSSEGLTLREQINAILDRSPNATVDYIADLLEGDRKYVRKLTREEMKKREQAA